MITREEYQEAKRELIMARTQRAVPFEEFMGCECGYATSCNCYWGYVIKTYKEQDHVQSGNLRSLVDSL